MLDFLSIALVAGVPAAAVLYTRRRPSTVVYELQVAPRSVTPAITRTDAQKTADQERFDRLGLPRILEPVR